MLFQLSPGVSTIRTHYKAETFSSRADDTEDLIFVKYFVDIGIFYPSKFEDLGLISYG